MTLDPEELKRRRKQKQQQRELARKKLLLRLGLGLGIVAAVIVLIVIFSQSGGSDQEDTPPVTTEPPTSQASDAATQPQEKTTVIHFTAAGDLNINEQVVASGGSGYDYTGAFLDVAALLADADVATVNLEGNLCGAPYGSSASAPQTMMQALSSAGVDLIQLANSYSINRGISGLRTTIDSVRQAGMEPVGVWADQSSYDESGGFTLLNIQGVKIAVVAFTKGMDGTTLPPGSESCVNVLYSDYDSTYQKVNTEKITQVLDAVARETPDITIALLHWGSEFNDTVSRTQETICNLMLEKGVDAIIGTHPHYVQQVKFDEDAGTLVAYSLGDFFGDAQRAGSEYSILLDIEITKNNETGQTSITDYSYTPLFTVAEENKPLRVVRIHEAMAAYEAGYIDRVSKETYDDMAYALKRIEARVAGN